MKIQCDVCNKEEASFYCVADDAALCRACDHRVHHANKLASKHQRFTLLPPSPQQPPLCDICKERKAFVFCQQDRAILCRECDVPIHTANEHTKKHNRFLLTGVKISATSDVYSSASDSVPSLKSQVSSNKAVVVSPGPISNTCSEASNHMSGGFMNEDGDGGLTSSLSEYLEMLPGYHVEELLDSSSPDGLCKIGDNDVFPFWGTDLESSICSISSEKAGVWVPQASPLQHNHTQFLHSAQIGFARKWTDDNSFAVPEMRTSSTTFKRSRNVWQ